MKYELLTFGVPMYEFVRQTKDLPFAATGSFVGPFPSGDTCILADVASRLGVKCCYLGPFGDDTFSPSVINRLAEHGTDISHITMIRNSPSYLVFVRYNTDGKREYLTFPSLPLLDSITPDLIPPEIVKQSLWIHFSGEIIRMCGLDNRKRETILFLLEQISPESKVSLDPNFDSSTPETDQMIAPFIKRADLILPSEGEAMNLLHTDSDQEACRKWADQGKIIVLKEGRRGCTIYVEDQTIHVDAFHAEEIDPTGCGDSFCAGFLSGLIQGETLYDAALTGNAAGALQASALGPMEGIITPERIRELLNKQ